MSERYYQVIVKKPINMNPTGKVYSFMPGETHRLPEHIGKVIFTENSPYTEYFNLVEIYPPLEAVNAEYVTIDEVLKGSDTPALNDLSVAVESAPIEPEHKEVKAKKAKEEVK